jgi:UDPglucose--hexose-1-phosphate uridylyltransferase
MPHNELRKDYLLDRWVVIATERARRPTDFTKPKKENNSTQTNICPLCPGNEHMTPPAILVYLNSNGSVVKDRDTDTLRHKNWLLRCIPNLYPAFAPPKQTADETEIMKSDDFGLAVGHHEVLVESPVHDAHIADAELSQLTHVINGYIDRLRELSSKGYVKYVSIFRNHGAEAGASLTHAHSQLIAMPFVPTLVEEEIAASMEFQSKNNRCFFCDLIERETNSPRFITENEHFTVFAPYASINPLEFWILPKKHQANLLDLTATEKEKLAQMMKTMFKALKDLVNDPPYNYGFHNSINKEDQDCYHWHLEVYPKLAVWAGFEKSTGTYINTVPPESAAAELRNTVRL